MRARCDSPRYERCRSSAKGQPLGRSRTPACGGHFFFLLLFVNVVTFFCLFFALRYLVASYGFVVVLVNALMLFLLAAIFQGSITSRSFLSILLGGLIIGVLGLAFETLAGATEPILDRKPEADEEHTA